MSVTPICAGIVVALLGACAKSNPYACRANDQCVAHGAGGQCVAGSCAFADSTCTGGLRYENTAGGGLAGTCTAAMTDAGVMIDAPIATCITDITFGRRFGCYTKSDHSVWCAGENSRGQLGFGVAGVPSASLMEVRDSTSAPIADATAIGAGRNHACAVRADGTVWCWGANESGELGNAASFGSGSGSAITPADQAKAVQVMTSSGPLTGIVEVSGSYVFTCARDASGGVWCWGANGNGELGDGTTTGRSTAAPVLVAPGGAAFTGAIELSVGGGTTCARNASSEVWCWGENQSGQLGDGTTAFKSSPIRIATSPSVAVGMWHVCYVDADTTITCQGASEHARLGNGSGEGYNDGNYTTGIKVVTSRGGSNFTGATKIVAGALTCALDASGGVWCWGDDPYGQTGTGTSTVVPARVLLPDYKTPLTGVDRLVAHWPHICAHETAGTWRCWGRGSEGEFGDGAFANRGFAMPLAAGCP